MVLQLCGRVCRRLSLKNPHHEFDEDFLRLIWFVVDYLVPINFFTFLFVLAWHNHKDREG